MKKLLILVVVGALGYVVYNQYFRYEFYEGTWVSNKEMTLESMNRVKRIPQKARVAMESLFGKMVIHIEDGQMEYYFKDDPDYVTKQSISFEVLSSTRVRYTTYDPLSRKDKTTELVFSNDCYAVEVPKWKFKEYFCRKPLF